MRLFHRREPRHQLNMKKSALRFLVLIGLSKVALCAYFGYNTYIKSPMNWTDAREYCREHFTDLTSFNNEEESTEFNRSVITTGQFADVAWIGLYKDTNGTWKWSAGQNASFFNWLSQNSTFPPNGKCVAIRKQHWSRWYCDRPLHFFCFQSTLVLVKENKTWEEAMEHCRHLDKELVSLPSESALATVLQASKEAQTDHVWTGLRFLAGSWLWVDGSFVDYEAWNQGKMPQCPVWSHHCGGLSLKEGQWSSWDCEDTLNFICY